MSKFQGLTCKLVFAITAASFGGGFQHGFNTGNIANPQRIIQDWTRDTLGNRTDTEPDKYTITLIYSTMVAIFCAGGIIGGLLSGVIADGLGRKGGLLWNNILVVLTTICFAFSKTFKTFELFIAGRFLIGINSAINSALSPMYLSEISTTRLRGAVGSVYQLIITISILLAQILSIEACFGSEELWPILFSIPIIPALFQVITLICCPESPKHLLANKGPEECQNALKWFRGNTPIDSEMAELKIENDDIKSRPKVTLRDMSKEKYLRKPLVIAIVIMLAQQFSGINAVIFFSTDIFHMSGIKGANATYMTVGIGIINVLMTIISLVLVEVSGRKTLLLVGFGGMFVTTILLFLGVLFAENSLIWSYLGIGCVFLYIIFFASGAGSIPWFLVSEIFNQSSRPMATSIAVCTNWLANTFVTLTFLPIKEIIGAYVFLIYAVLQVLFFTFILFKVPETKNRPVEDIVKSFE